jgi:hypothetical protein
MRLLSVTILLFGLSLSSCQRDCDGTPPRVYVSNYCAFKMEVEVDVIGDKAYTEVLDYGESVSYKVHETKVSIKAKEYAPLITLARTKNFEARNCKSYYIEFIENDSATFYDFDLKYESNWN